MPKTPQKTRALTWDEWKLLDQAMLSFVESVENANYEDDDEAEMYTVGEIEDIFDIIERKIKPEPEETH